MTDEQALKLADAITRGVVADHFWVYLLALALAVVFAAITAWLVEFFKTSGKNYATRADFDELLSQVRKTTVAQEEIKTAISHGIWQKQEYLQLRRMKLEELLAAIYACEAWLHKLAQSIVGPNGYKEIPELDGESPARKLGALAALYFPELVEVKDFQTTFDECLIAMYSSMKQAAEAYYRHQHAEAAAQASRGTAYAEHLTQEAAGAKGRFEKLATNFFTTYQGWTPKIREKMHIVEVRAGEVMSQMIKPNA